MIDLVRFALSALSTHFDIRPELSVSFDKKGCTVFQYECAQNDVYVYIFFMWKFNKVLHSFQNIDMCCNSVHHSGWILIWIMRYSKNKNPNEEQMWFQLCFMPIHMDWNAHINIKSSDKMEIGGLQCSGHENVLPIQMIISHRQNVFNLFAYIASLFNSN